MADISKIQEILKDANFGEYVSLKCENNTININGHVVYLSEDKVDAVDISKWTKGWPKEEPTELGPLCFTAEAPNSSVKLQKRGSAVISGFNGLEYKKVSATPLFSAGADEWKPYTIGSFGQNNELNGLNVGDKVYMRAVADGNSRMGTDMNKCHIFVMTGKIAASGNVNTLLNPDPNAEVSLEGMSYCYSNMFSSCTSLTQAPDLPAMTLAEQCYNYMFEGCTSLTQAPDLPATTLADGCYSNMFSSCTSLTQAPDLPAMTLANWCYENMFYNTQQLQEITFSNLSRTDVINIVEEMGLGLPHRQVVICYCSDGVVIINDNDDSSSGENNSIS